MRKRGELVVELKLIGDADEELRSGARGLTWKNRRDDGSLLESDAADLRLEAEIESASAVPGAGLRILRLRVAGLDNAVRDHAVKRRAVVKALPRKLDELPDMIWRLVGIELHDE